METIELLNKIIALIGEMAREIRKQASEECNDFTQATLFGKAEGMESVAKQIEILVKVQGK